MARRFFVQNAQVEGLFAECTMSNHNDRFDMLTCFIQSWTGWGVGVFFWFLKARQHFHSLRINMDAGVSILGRGSGSTEQTNRPILNRSTSGSVT